MRQKSGPQKPAAEQVIKDIRRATRKHHSAEDKIRIVLDGLRGEDSIAAICRREGIVYQGFSLLTANLDVLQDPLFREIADRTGAGVAPIVFRFAQQVGMLPLTGTTDVEHMKADLACGAFTLTDDEVRRIESAAG